MRLLCLSNGHGEDVIAVKILQALAQRLPSLEIAALPLVGEGSAYQNQTIRIIGPVQSMPSGGFIYMDGRELAKDVQGGLVQLTWRQGCSIHRWVKETHQLNRNNRANNDRRQGSLPVLVLAVGDIVPLGFAWWSGLPYAFVGTAKSEYYLRDEVGLLPQPKLQTGRMAGGTRSVYFPWELWLMKRSRCRAVFPRDQITADVLQPYRIPVCSLGNPMMDHLEPRSLLSENVDHWENSLKVLLLPGSRFPEAQRNWERILQAVDSIQEQYPGRRLILLAALSPALDLAPFIQALTAQGWRSSLAPTHPVTPTSISYSRYSATLQFSQSSYNEYLHLADVAIAMAGTATEQFAGLGKPVISLPGWGPQFTQSFAEAQTRLLGASVTLCGYPAEVGLEIKKMMANPDRLHIIAQNGRHRLGKPGAAHRIATHLFSLLSCSG